MLLDTIIAAEYLGLRPNTLEVWRSYGKGPRYKKIGSRVLYSMDDLDEFITDCTVETIDSYIEV